LEKEQLFKSEKMTEGVFEFDTRVGKIDYLNTYYLFIPADIVKTIGGVSGKRFVCLVNEKINYQSGLVALGDGEAYICISTKRMKEAGCALGDIVRLKLTPDKSEFGLDVPEELQEVFNQDPEGEERFRKLTPGKQRYIIYYVSGVKNPQLRVDRALLLIGNLKKLPVGKEEFKAMLGKA